MNLALTPEDRRKIADWIHDQIGIAIQAHEMKHHKRASSKRFVKPTVEQVAEYVQQINAGIDPQRFIDYYDANGWKVGRVPMKDWQAAVRTWKKGNAPPAAAQKPIRLCDCGCGQPAKLGVGDKWFASSECRKKVLKW